VRRESLHLANTLVDVGISRQRQHLCARQLRHAHLALLRGLLRARERDLLLGSDGLCFDLTQKLLRPPKKFSSLSLSSFYSFIEPYNGGKLWG
jgi:hypothetical protein